jgi:ribosomal protein S18 acetylase RimI-like enzyme
MILREAEFPADHALVKALFTEYAEELGVDLRFQGFEDELASLPGKYGPPQGALLIADENACVALRNLGRGVCEMKRLFVRPNLRNSGAGRLLAEAIVRRAEEIGYQEMVLDTLKTLRPAIHLYQHLGFSECEPYYENPLTDAVYMRRILNAEHAPPSTLQGS